MSPMGSSGNCHYADVTSTAGRGPRGGRAQLLGQLLISVAAITCVARVSRADVTAPPPWWQEAVFYEIYPRSFADTNGDGVGDLPGIVARLDYLHELGVEAIWLTPCFPSPQVDFGYDVTDYEAIDPAYGTLGDLDRLVAEGRKRGIKVILDLVLNHTSDQHPWFVESRSSRTSPRRDWYVWRDGKPDGKGGTVPPNNWVSLFGGSAWRFDRTTGQYYYHYFYPEQPDLNWRNPAVETAMLDVTRWWYSRGVAGFRLDAVDTLFESTGLEDNPVLPKKNALGDPITVEQHNKNLPEIHGVLRQLRRVADEANAVLIGETWTDDIEQLAAYYGERGQELQMPMDLMFATVDKLDPAAFRRQIAAAESMGHWPVYLLGNHDRPRSYNRYGDGRHDDAIAKMMAVFYLTLRGSPILYYGEEIGMANNDPQRRQDVHDPIGRRGWPLEKGRDGERTPMQWSSAANAGFTTGHPWLPVPPSYVSHNVASERRDPSSIFNLYKKVLSLRHTSRVVRLGSYAPLNEDDANVLSYLRSLDDKAVLVAVNMSGRRVEPRFDLGHGVGAVRLRPLIATQGSTARAGTVSLGPFGAFVAEVTSRRPPTVTSAGPDR